MIKRRELIKVQSVHKKVIRTHRSKGIKVKVIRKIVKNSTVRERMQRSVPSVLIRDVHKYAMRKANRSVSEYTAGRLHAGGNGAVHVALRN